MDEVIKGEKGEGSSQLFLCYLSYPIPHHVPYLVVGRFSRDELSSCWEGYFLL